MDLNVVSLLGEQTACRGSSLLHQVGVRKEEITVEVVSCLVSEQFPQWADLDIRRVSLDGWDDTDLSPWWADVGSPAWPRALPGFDKEHRWLPLLAAHLPVPIPRPLAKGRPGCGFPPAVVAVRLARW